MTGPDLTELPDGVIEHDGMLWKPRPEATTTALEFITARELFVALNHEAMWNPWIRDERKDDIDRTADVMGQWTRAEPGHRQVSVEQWEAQEARRERRRAKERTNDEARWERDRDRYDEQRATARLRLIEVQSRHDHETAELEGFRDGTKYPAMDRGRRAKAIQDLEERIAQLDEDIGHLAPIVGEPEDVVDEHGRLPRDRRIFSLCLYRLDRERAVRKPKDQIPRLEAALQNTTDRAERRECREELAKATRELDQLVAAGPYTADEMCSECPTPMAHQGWVSPPASPCPAWPGQVAKRREVLRMLEMFAKGGNDEATPQPTPKPEPLAVLPSDLPIAEVIARLSQLHEQFPQAVVRRGRANRWELWASEDQ